MKIATAVAITLWAFGKDVLGCMPQPDWVPATVAEQVTNAAVVVDGTVVGMTGSVNEGTVEVEVLKYLCGCGREKITVTGLRSTSLCGPGIPTVKTRAVFFLCPSDDGSVYRANDITLHTGWVANQNGNLENATTESELACAQAPLTPGECAGQNLQPRMCQNIRAARVVKPDEFDEF